MLFSIVVQIRVDLNFADKIYYRAVASSINGGGGLIFIYSGSAQFLFKSIVFMVCEHEYMNISPPPSNYRARYGSVLLITSYLVISRF